MAIEQFRYDGKRVLVVGGATGMGAAAAKGVAELGAKVIVMDVADVSFPTEQSIKVDLRDEASVDAAIAQIKSPVHAVFSCAGVADGTRGLMLINFTAQRHIIESLIAKKLLGRGGSVAMISSVAGLGWEKNLPTLLEFLGNSDWKAADSWVGKHEGTDTYSFSKQAMNAYVAHEAFRLLKQGIRINSILPAPTNTPLARANADIWLAFGAEYRQQLGMEAHPPEHMGNAMIFLCCDAAAGINGTSLLVDAGHVSSAITGSYDEPGIKMMMGLA
jgi:NAD(P)-dependent dehydrogenase (short-subunit alcohol dehydrogenase family)